MLRGGLRATHATYVRKGSVAKGQRLQNCISLNSPGLLFACGAAETRKIGRHLLLDYALN